MPVELFATALLAGAYRTHDRILDYCERYDSTHTEPARPGCSGTILCECQRRSCLGHTVSVDTYWRKLRRS